MPSRSGFQLAREKKAWARSWDQARVNPAPISMPVTVPRPVCAIRPVTSAAKVVNVGVVKQPRRNVSTANSEAVRSNPEASAGPLTAGDASTADASLLPVPALPDQTPITHTSTPRRSTNTSKVKFGKGPSERASA